MTRKEFESLSLNARLWAKLGENFDPPCKVEKRGGWFLNGKAYGPTGYLLVELDTCAPALDSDDSPRRLLREALKVVLTPDFKFEFLAHAVGDEWRDQAIIWVIINLPAADLAAAIESVLPLPEWVKE